MPDRRAAMAPARRSPGCRPTSRVLTIVNAGGGPWFPVWTRRPVVAENSIRSSFGLHASPRQNVSSCRCPLVSMVEPADLA